MNKNAITFSERTMRIKYDIKKYFITILVLQIIIAKVHVNHNGILIVVICVEQPHILFL